MVTALFADATAQLGGHRHVEDRFDDWDRQFLLPQALSQLGPGVSWFDVDRDGAEDVARRPDVMVVESGEIELPGDVRMRDIGLPSGVVYACLAETVVLALEGRYETFTVGREIEWEKVKEIYQIGLKHGMKLAAISGVNGVYSDEDLARIRELALARRAEMAAASGS